MPVTFVSGDLFAHHNLDALAHGCNCAGAMGRGIAVEFKRRWPAMYKAYREKCLNGEFLPGDVFVWKEGGITIYNLGTQRTWRTGATEEAIRASLEGMIAEAQSNDVKTIGIPKIGAGLGGLAWDVVKRIIEEAAAHATVELIVFETFREG